MASPMHRLSLPSGVKAGGSLRAFGFVAVSLAFDIALPPLVKFLSSFVNELMLFKIALRETLEEKGMQNI